MSETREIIRINRDNRYELFTAAYDGSYYTILGCGGGLGEWTTGYTELLEESCIGTPKQFITFTGDDLNINYSLIGDNAYKPDLTCLMFTLDGLDTGKLAIFKLRMGDRWFDDIADNNQRLQDAMKDKEGQTQERAILRQESREMR